MESAEKNKQYALYTLAMVQNTLTKELEKKGEKIAFNELQAIDGVIETATKNPNPMLRASAIAALSYVSRPEYREVLDSIFEAAEKDEDDSVKDVARYARSKMNATGQATGAENAAPAEAKQEENKAEAAK